MPPVPEEEKEEVEYPHVVHDDALVGLVETGGADGSEEFFDPQAAAQDDNNINNTTTNEQPKTKDIDDDDDDDAATGKKKHMTVAADAPWKDRMWEGR